MSAGRVDRRGAELELVAAAFYERKATAEQLRVAALRYAAAVTHNRRARERHKTRIAATWQPKAADE
jgi:hypothetical protein